MDLSTALHGDCRDVFKTHGLIGNICLLLQFVSTLFVLLQLNDQRKKIHVNSIVYMCSEVIVYIILAYG